MRVLEQTRRADGKRSVDHVEERKQIFLYALGELGPLEMFENLLVGGVAERHRVELVGKHELVENIGTEHHSARNHNAQPPEVVAHGIFLYYRVDESETSAFASERTLPYTGEIGVMVEPILPEHSHHAAVFHLAVLHYEVEEKLTDGRSVVDRLEPVAFYYFGNGEQGSGIEPA